MSDLKRRFSRRDFLWVAGSTAAVMPLLAACAEATEEATQAAETGTELEAGERGGLWLPPEQPEMKEVVTSTNTPSYYTTLPWYIMNDYGFTEEEGFDKVEFIVAEGAFEGLISKDITFVANLDADEVMVSHNEGVPIVAVGTHRDHEWHIAGLSASIKKPTDLIGGTAILGTPGTRTFAQYRDHVLQWSDGEVDIETDMEHVKISGGSDARQQALIADEVQIANIYTRHLIGLKDAGCSWAVFGWYEWPQEAMCVHEDTAKNSPRTVINLLRAYLKSVNVVRNWDEKSAIIEFMNSHEMPLSDEFEIAWTSQCDQYSLDGAFRPQAMKFFLQDLANFDIIPQDTVYDQIWDVSFIDKAQQELTGASWPPPKANDFFTSTGFPLVVQLQE
jgi:ABC-type nitrate/sulfonate/bicarbonate transport system substrate-binding protein